MKNYEKKALIKFTFIYFISTAILVIVLGFLYFGQQKNQILQQYTMKMHEYGMKLKQTKFKYKQDGYSYEITNASFFQYKLAFKDDKYYKKSFPMRKGKQFLFVKVDSNIVDDKLNEVKKFTIILQLSLILFFLLISFLLAKLSLKPMNDTISHLDRFIKDLIHDLNTPATAILLNTKMLKKELNEPKSLNKLERINKSANAITSLYENLEILLSSKLEKQRTDLYSILEDKKENVSLQYSNIIFDLEKKEMLVDTNEKAINRIIDNILSNSCKYSKDEPFIEITFNQNILTIIDNGKGIKYPKNIFERSYSEQDQGHGIGMHIVQRLCNELDIDISIDSVENTGTIVKLKFK